MKKEKVIKVTLVTYFDPAEDLHYDELIESLGDKRPRDVKEWLRTNIVAAASYDKHMVDEGHFNVMDFFHHWYNDSEPPEYQFEVVEFTTHDDGEVTERTIHTCKDTAIAIEDPTTQDTIAFYKAHGRVPNLGELLMMSEARASVKLDKGDGSTWSVHTGKPKEENG